MKLENKVAFITGGTSGIGLETAKLFRAQGSRIAIVGSNAKRLQEAGKDLGGAALTVLADLRKVADIERAVEETRTKLGRIDVVFAREDHMEYATLGNTGLLVSKLCFGTMTFGNGRGLFKAL